MKKEAVITLIVWLACGLYTWGTTMANSNYKDAHEFANLKQGPRDNSGFAGLLTITGPIGAIGSMFGTNFNQHGWTLWSGYSR